MTFQSKEGFTNSRGMLMENTPPGALEVALECAFAPFDSLGGGRGDEGYDCTFLVGATLNLVEGNVEAATAVLTALRGDNFEAARARSCVMIEPLSGGKFQVVLITPNGNTQIHVTPGQVRVVFSDGSSHRASRIRAAMPIGIRFDEKTEE